MKSRRTGATAPGCSCAGSKAQAAKRTLKAARSADTAGSWDVIPLALCSVPGTSARMLTKVLLLLIPILNKIWCDVAKSCNLPSTGSWTINRTSQVPPIIHNTLQQEANRLRHPEVYDFKGMHCGYIRCQTFYLLKY
jgi:hypothetical protein